MFSRLALASIHAYQRWLSPHKGYRCAYSVLHGGTGCSGYAKYAIRDHGLWQSLSIIRQRLRDCRHAARELRTNCVVCSQKTDKDGAQEKSGKNRSSSCATERRHAVCDACGAAACLPCSALASASGSDPAASSGSAGADTPAPGGDGCGSDCGAAGCDAPDCGGCDCAPSCG